MRKLLFPLSVAAFIIGMVGYSFAQDANPLSTNLAADTKAASPSHLVTYKDPTYGFALTSPQGWSSITPNKISELTRGAFKPTPDTLIFVVNDADPDQNINIQFRGRCAWGRTHKHASAAVLGTDANAASYFRQTTNECHFFVINNC